MKKNITTSLKIEKIIVKNLFKKFDYDFNLNNGYDISVLIGPNGCGKTTIFNILDFIFCPTTVKFKRIQDIPFEMFECLLSDNRSLTLYKFNEKLNKDYIDNINLKTKPKFSNGDLIFRIGNSEEKVDMRFCLFYEYYTNKSLDEDKDYSDFERFIRHKILRARHVLRSDNSSDEVISDDDFLNYRYSDEIFRYNHKRFSNENPKPSFFDKLTKTINGLSINYIPANRLFDVKKSKEYLETLSLIKKEIVENFNALNDEYNKRQSKAKDVILKDYVNIKKYPSQDIYIDFSNIKELKEYLQNTDFRSDVNIAFLSELLKHDKGSFEVNYDETKDVEKEVYLSYLDKWINYIKVITAYSKVHLVDENDVIEFFKDEHNFCNAFCYKFPFMYVYINAFADTLLPFKDFYEKLNLFLKILNKRNEVAGKVFSFSKSEGIFLEADGESLPLECMSSGQKNDFVMFYNLIFNSQKGHSLVLIDEPEISLHIEWQQSVIDHMLDICKLNGAQLIVATHSPHILNGHYELLINGREKNE